MLGTNKVTYTPSGGGKATQYVDGTVLFCNTKQIDVIASTPFGELSLIKDELTPNIPYSGPLKETVLYDYTSGQSRFNTLEEAQAQCSTDPECTGIEQEFADQFKQQPYSTRKGKKLSKSAASYEEFAFAKIESASSIRSPWKIKIAQSKDWTISK